MKTFGLLALVLVASLQASARTVERIIAIVNDRPILQSDVDGFRDRLNKEGLVDDALLSLTDKNKLLKDRTALINHLIDEALLDSEVKKKNLEVTVERVEQEIRNILRGRRINRAQLKDVLAEKGATMSEYQAFIKASIERQSLIEREVSSRIKISDEDVAAHYLSTAGPSKNQAFEYSLEHILFLPSNGGDKGARERANAVAEKIKAGQSFEKLAEQYSEDPNFSQNGFLGNFKSGEMLKEIEDAVRPIGQGEVTGVIKTKAGVQLIKVVKKTVTSDPRLDENREQIRSVLFADVFKRQFRAWLDQKREESFIRMNEVADAKAK